MPPRIRALLPRPPFAREKKAPAPEAPLPIPPEIRPDRLDEISPAQAAPDVAALPPSMTSPTTLNRATVPDFAAGDPKDRSPARAAPRESYKRPKSIGPEPNRAPTAVPQPVEDIFKPAEAEPEIPSASAGEPSPEPAADAKPALPDSAPARAPQSTSIRSSTESRRSTRITRRSPTRHAPERAAGWKLVADERLALGECRVITPQAEADVGCQQRLDACLDTLAEHLHLTEA